MACGTRPLANVPVALTAGGARVAGHTDDHGEANPRPPLLALDGAAAKALADTFTAMPALAAEPRGW